MDKEIINLLIDTVNLQLKVEQKKVIRIEKIVRKEKVYVGDTIWKALEDSNKRVNNLREGLHWLINRKRLQDAL